MRTTPGRDRRREIDRFSFDSAGSTRSRSFIRDFRRPASVIDGAGARRGTTSGGKSSHRSRSGSRDPLRFPGHETSSRVFAHRMCFLQPSVVPALPRQSFFAFRGRIAGESARARVGILFVQGGHDTLDRRISASRWSLPLALAPENLTRELTLPLPFEKIDRSIDRANRRRVASRFLRGTQETQGVLSKEDTSGGSRATVFASPSPSRLTLTDSAHDW